MGAEGVIKFEQIVVGGGPELRDLMWLWGQTGARGIPMW